MRHVLFYVATIAIVVFSGGCTRRIVVPVEQISVCTDTVKIATARSDTLIWRDSVVRVERGDTIRTEVWHTREKVKWRAAEDYHTHHDTVVKEVPVTVPTPSSTTKEKSQSLKSRISDALRGIGVLGIFIVTVLIILKIKRNEKIDEIIVHCSATPERKAFTVEDIDRWHRQRNFKCIGYHYVVYVDGTVHTGRPETEMGAHCSGHNAHSIGVCYIGGLASDGKTPKDTRTSAQKEGLKRLLRELKTRYPKARVTGHREYANKACPCFDVATEYRNLKV